MNLTIYSLVSWYTLFFFSTFFWKTSQAPVRVRQAPPKRARAPLPQQPPPEQKTAPTGPAPSHAMGATSVHVEGQSPQKRKRPRSGDPAAGAAAGGGGGGGVPPQSYPPTTQRP